MMAPLPACRVLVDATPGSGLWNMAVDELLLEAAVERDQSSLRWYRWDRPTISLGYFQTPDAARAAPELSSLPIVPRLSGGGAIVHDREFTYSCALPSSHPLSVEPRALYAHVHRTIIAVLAEFGIPVAFRGETDKSRGGEFLCFGRGDSFDVVLGPHKVLGSAQRRRKGAILQHGSLVLQHSAHAPQFPGILDLASVTIDPAQLLDRLVDSVASVLSSVPTAGILTAAEIREVERRVAVRRTAGW